MSDDENRRRFELLAMPHLDASYNLARWLTHNEHDAQDVVQEALVRALRYIGGFRGDSARAWLLQIVRHTCYTWLRKNRPSERLFLDEADEAWQDMPAPSADEPQAVAMRNADRAQINRAIADLPIAFREVLVLRELEDLSYSDIARIADIPLGTVMSRLSRARGLMRQALAPVPAPAPAARPVLRTVPSSPPRATGGGGMP
ncbi:MAG: sigma-70 family RNA polymerase sigma factor [Bacteriovorax sp.]|nr:sigma-70 family RNA polymerase sigma factor [Rhizobacter sp.]